MATVWIVFVATALILAAGAFAALRFKGLRAPVFRKTGAFLLVMAGGTAAFPSVLPILRPVAWAGSYVCSVVPVTTAMTVSAVVSSRCLPLG
ncbi:MAG: hypothetical protein RMK57_01870 [Bryobacterales bacterium]|nr:hypothetical protein [Bryobacteraceae bacterium]MDW8353251.1 hypothetical protein [Bryobacterales bacterium]